MKIRKDNLWRYTKDIIRIGKRKILLAFIMMVCTAICNLLQPQLIKFIIDKAIPLKKVNLLFELILLYIVVALLVCIFNYVLTFIYSILKRSISIKYKNRLVHHLTNMHTEFIEAQKSGEILKVLEDDIFNIENFGIETIFTIVSQVITAFTALYFLIAIQPIAFFTVIFLEIIEGVIQYYYTKKIAGETNVVRQIAGSYFSILEEFVTNMTNIVISKCKMVFWKKLIQEEKNFKRKSIKLDVNIELSTNISSFLHVLITMSIYLIGGYWVICNSMSLGTLIIYIEYVNMFTGPINSIIRLNAQIQQTCVSLNHIYQILDTESDIVQDNNGKRATDGIKDIEYDNISFSYKNGRTVLKDLSISFAKGKITAIVGNTGCGKTTLVRLLYRLWDAKKGTIKLNSVPIQNYNLYYLRQQISFVSQDVLIFNATIWNNIVGSSDMGKKEVLEICKKVGIDEFVMNFNEGYMTIVGERGAKLSGGQKQKIAIARALIDKGSILIMDEATAAMDNITQQGIMENIRPYLENKIVIIIAHRLAVVKGADNIYVLKNGECVGRGSHHTLLERCEEYRKLYETEDQIIR